MTNPTDALSAGMQHHQAGQLAQAEQLYRQALAIDPEHPHGLFLLGSLMLQVGNIQSALELLSKATNLGPREAAFHANLAEAHRAAGDLNAACASNRIALSLRPDHFLARFSLGIALRQQGKLNEAADCISVALHAQPNDLESCLALGEIELERGRLSEATTLFRRAIVTDSRNPRALLGLGVSSHRAGRLAEARRFFEAAITASPDFAVARVNLGATLRDLHLPADAERHYREAIRLEPQLTAAYCGLGGLLDEQHRCDEAIACLSKAIEIDPTSAGAFSALARTRLQQGDLDNAAADAKRSLEFDPGRATALCNLASCYRGLGRLDEAIATYRAAMRLDPGDVYQYSNLLYTLIHHPDYEPAAIFEEHRAWARLLADPLTEAARPHTNDPTTDRRLRIGYVSAHFCDHAVNFFSEPLLAVHDHDAIEMHCYSNGSSPDDVNARLRVQADHWREIGHLTDEQAAQLVRQDKIDILVDLSGHIAGHRLLLFARKPAPVQVSYLGYQATTGMQAMDYRFTDEWSDPPNVTDAYYTEKLMRLPRTFFCYQPSPDAPPVAPLPASKNGHITFGSFNNFAKITPKVLATWIELLQRVPKSRLVLLAHAVPSLNAYVQEQLASHGLEPDRMTVVNRCRRAEYLQHIAQVDIALDPFPLNGHTTTCDALWQGVPVVTLAGNIYASRFGSSAHVNLELKDLVADTPEQYVTIAASLAGDLPRLQVLRGDLRSRMVASPLLDGPAFARRVEGAYRTIWSEWCQVNAK